MSPGLQATKCTATPSRVPGSAAAGYRGLNALPATVSTDKAAPVVVAQRLRRGVAHWPATH